MARTDRSGSKSWRPWQKLKRSLKKRLLWRRFGEQWNRVDPAFQKRDYTSYDAYLEHQKSKLGIHDFANYDVEFREALRERMSRLDVNWRGRTVLCLAARIGTEVKAFIDLGCFAVGIDLNPGANNRFVVHGDFHDLQYAPGSVDIVYTNSLDHAFDIDRIGQQILKVLKADGRLIVEAAGGTEQGVNPGFFESLSWASIDSLIGIIERAGFELERRMEILKPWPGESLLFRTGPAAG